MRLFLLHIVVLETKIIVTGPLDAVFEEFRRMNESQAIGMASELTTGYGESVSVQLAKFAQAGELLGVIE